MRTAAPTFGVEHRPIQESRSSVADVWRIGRPVWRNIASHCRSAETTGGAVWTEHRPIQNRGRVAFPTLRPPRLRLFGGPAPWTKRGKRTTAVTLVEVGSTPDRERGETVRCQATSKTDPGRHEIRPPVDQRHGVDGVIHALSTATIPSQSSRGGQGVDNPLDDLGRSPFQTLRDAARTETSPHSNRGRVAFPTLRPPRLSFVGDRRRGQSVDNPVSAVPLIKRGGQFSCRQGVSFRCRLTHPNIAPFIRGGRADENRPILLTYTVLKRRLSTFGSTQPVTPAVKRKRRQDPRQTTFEFRPAGRGGARPGAGRRRTRRSRVPHRTRGGHPPGLPGAGHPARAGRRAAAAPGGLRAGVPGVSPKGVCKTRVSRCPLFHPERPCPLPGRGGTTSCAWRTA